MCGWCVTYVNGIGYIEQSLLMTNLDALNYLQFRISRFGSANAPVSLLTQWRTEEGSNKYMHTDTRHKMTQVPRWLGLCEVLSTSASCCRPGSREGNNHHANTTSPFSLSDDGNNDTFSSLLVWPLSFSYFAAEDNLIHLKLFFFL